MHALQLRLVAMLPTAALPRKEHLTASKDAAGRPVQQGQTIEGHIGGAILCCKLTRLSSSSRWCVLRQWEILETGLQVCKLSISFATQQEIVRSLTT